MGYKLEVKDADYARFAYSKNLVENSYWYDTDELNNCYLLALTYNNELVCLANLYARSSMVWVSMIESVQQGTGSGREMIKRIFLEGKELMNLPFEITSLSGESMAQAIRFWKSMGAELNMSEDEIADAEEDETGLYPFMLDKAIK